MRVAGRCFLSPGRSLPRGLIVSSSVVHKFFLVVGWVHVTFIPHVPSCPDPPQRHCLSGLAQVVLAALIAPSISGSTLNIGWLHQLSAGGLVGHQRPLLASLSAPLVKCS